MADLVVNPDDDALSIIYMAFNGVDPRVYRFRRTSYPLLSRRRPQCTRSTRTAPCAVSAAPDSLLAPTPITMGPGV